MYKILIVDDEPSMLKLLNKILKDGIVNVFEASNGVEAKKIFFEEAIDLIVTDLVMPEKHGIDLIMEIKKVKPDLPIIAISGGGGVTGRFDYLEIAELLGVNNILHKPFDGFELKKLVFDALKNNGRKEG